MKSKCYYTHYIFVLCWELSFANGMILICCGRKNVRVVYLGTDARQQAAQSAGCLALCIVSILTSILARFQLWVSSFV